jgi:hypothetical protein
MQPALPLSATTHTIYMEVAGVDSHATICHSLLIPMQGSHAVRACSAVHTLHSPACTRDCASCLLTWPATGCTAIHSVAGSVACPHHLVPLVQEEHLSALVPTQMHACRQFPELQLHAWPMCQAIQQQLQSIQHTSAWCPHHHTSAHVRSAGRHDAHTRCCSTTAAPHPMQQHTAAPQQHHTRCSSTQQHHSRQQVQVQVQLHSMPTRSHSCTTSFSPTNPHTCSSSPTSPHVYAQPLPPPPSTYHTPQAQALAHSDPTPPPPPRPSQAPLLPTGTGIPHASCTTACITVPQPCPPPPPGACSGPCHSSPHTTLQRHAAPAPGWSQPCSPEPFLQR